MWLVPFWVTTVPLFAATNSIRRMLEASDYGDAFSGWHLVDIARDNTSMFIHSLSVFWTPVKNKKKRPKDDSQAFSCILRTHGNNMTSGMFASHFFNVSNPSIYARTDLHSWLCGGGYGEIFNSATWFCYVGRHCFDFLKVCGFNDKPEADNGLILLVMYKVSMRPDREYRIQLLILITTN